jgi:hypothetical protein
MKTFEIRFYGGGATICYKTVKGRTEDEAVRKFYKKYGDCQILGIEELIIERTVTTMKKFYYVEQKVFDNGKVQTHIGEIEADSKPDDVNKDTVKYDLYRNYFDDKGAADKFYKENH